MKKTKSTTTYKKWDIVLVPFPFTDMTTTKRRPALVVSPPVFNRGEEIVIAFITSNLKVRTQLGDYIIENWSGAKLPKPSLIRMRFASLSKTIIVKKIGRLTEKDAGVFKDKLIEFFSK